MHLQHIREELRQFPDMGADMVHPVSCGALDTMEMVLYMQDAAAGGGNDIVEFGEVLGK